MPRNPKFNLDAEQIERADRFRGIAVPFAQNEIPVKVAFVKRDGTPRILVGTAVSVTGDGSSEILSVMTDDGIRSANLWAIEKIVPL